MTRLGWRSQERRGEGIGNPNAQLLKSVLGIGAFTAISLASEIGDVQRFTRARRMANY